MQLLSNLLWLLPLGLTCQDFHDSCAAWAKHGECEQNPAYMKVQCAMACNSCDWFTSRCLSRESMQGIAADVASRALRNAAGVAPGVRVLAEDPFVLAFDNFLNSKEIAAFKHYFAAASLTRSQEGHQVTDRRTSTQMWCNSDECLGDRLIDGVHQRIINLTGVPKSHAEHFQLVQYDVGQFYQVHHDQNSAPDTLAGVRLSTFFLHVQTPEMGGATVFPDLGIKVEPVAGLALWWPNVHDDLGTDFRTRHEAQTVQQGVKWVANLWLHQYDFRGPYSNGCDMAKKISASTDAKSEL